MLAVEIEPAHSVDRHPEQQDGGHQRVAGNEPGQGGHNCETDQSDTHAIERAEHAAEPTGLTGPQV